MSQNNFHSSGYDGRAPVPRAKATSGAQQDRRTISISDPAKNKHFCSNEVTTSKYSTFPFSVHFFFWKNLFEQFQKAANVYFLAISIMQVIPGLSPTGKLTTLIPLTIVITLALVKDGWEDCMRRKQDNIVNNRIANVFRDGKWIKVKRVDVKVGDIVACVKMESFPADVVILWTSEEDGLCYVETANLDGETNLKLRRSCELTQKILSNNVPAGTDMPHPVDIAGVIVSEVPNNRLYTFNGYMDISYAEKNTPRILLVADNVLLTGSELRNTHCAIGVVVFSGVDTKLMMNMTTRHHKTSKINSRTNWQIIFVFLFQIVLAIVCAIGHYLSHFQAEDHWYMGDGDVNEDRAGSEAALSFITFTILYNYFIPISLYIMMEVVKVIQAHLMNNDIKMYCPEKNTPAMVRNSQINEELGQVEYIFTDKTGTLTCNIMDFKKFSCMCPRPDGSLSVLSYGNDFENSSISDRKKNKQLSQEGFSFSDSRICDGNWQKQQNRTEIATFLEYMAICHTVLPDWSGKDVTYHAASPDEVCIVNAAAKLGFSLIKKTESVVEIELSDGTRKSWEILNIIEFTSSRKRMSVVVRTPEGRIEFIVKGADNVVFDMLSADQASMEAVAESKGLLTGYARDGLRTLVFAKGEITEYIYKRWNMKYNAANADIHERNENLDIVLRDLESELELVGMTAIEDQLQEGVPQTIELLSRAGTKVWVLTGDKQETAINIAHGCNLLHVNMGLFTFDSCDETNIRSELEKYIIDIKAAYVDAGHDIGIIIQGSVLQHILPLEGDPDAHEEEADLFVSLAVKCKTVICCRVSPIQKAQVVEAVKDRVNAVTLAIGDGANDVSMIQTAHVGVGICGLEGTQAARASDYSIAQFRFLQRLLIVHGRWNYNRISKLILFSFYKNMVLYITQFLYSFYNLFTGVTLYDPWSLAMYNLAFTSSPIMALAVFDKDVEAVRLLSIDQFPELYTDGIQNKKFNMIEFLKYTATASLQSAICFFLPAYICNDMIEEHSGRTLELPGHSITAYTCILLVVTIKCGFETTTWTVWNILTIFVSVYLWYLFLFFYCSVYMPIAEDLGDWYGADIITLHSATSWLTILIVTVVALLGDFIYMFYKKHFHQDLVHIVQEYESGDVPFNRYVVKAALPRLFPKKELKEFNPSLSEALLTPPMTARDRTHINGGSGSGTRGPMPSVMDSSFDLSSVLLHQGSSAAGAGDPRRTHVVTRTFVAAISDGLGVAPGRRRLKISDIIESDTNDEVLEEMGVGTRTKVPSQQVADDLSHEMSIIASDGVSRDNYDIFQK